MEKQHQRDFLEIERAVESRIKYLDTFNLSEEEVKHRKEELSIILKKLNKIRYYRLKPLESIETVRGDKFKIGEYFHIPGDELAKYKIIQFPDSITIRGVADNPPIGKPWICEVYVEDARKVKKEKKEKTKQIKKAKEIKLKIGDYFALVSNNTIYKAIEVDGKKVVGVNKLKNKDAPKRIKLNIKKTEVVSKTKKEYKKQHKAERRFKK